MVGIARVCHSVTLWARVWQSVPGCATALPGAYPGFSKGGGEEPVLRFEPIAVSSSGGRGAAPGEIFASLRAKSIVN